MKSRKSISNQSSRKYKFLCVEFLVTTGRINDDGISESTGLNDLRADAGMRKNEKDEKGLFI